MCFADGSEEPIDLIIYATGYNITFPFIAREHLNYQGDRPQLCFNVFHPERDDLFVAGLIQSDSGQFGLVDCQAQLIAAYVAGLARRQPLRRALPPFQTPQPSPPATASATSTRRATSSKSSTIATAARSKNGSAALQSISVVDLSLLAAARQIYRQPESLPVRGNTLRCPTLVGRVSDADFPLPSARARCCSLRPPALATEPPSWPLSRHLLCVAAKAGLSATLSHEGRGRFLNRRSHRAVENRGQRTN